jgi:hypothetical protein
MSIACQRDEDFDTNPPGEVAFDANDLLHFLDRP